MLLRTIPGPHCLRSGFLEAEMGVLKQAIYLRSDVHEKNGKSRGNGLMISNENEPQLDPMGGALAKITPGSGSHHEVPLLLVLCFSGDPFISPCQSVIARRL